MLNLTGTKSRRTWLCGAVLLLACDSSSASSPPPSPPPLPTPAAPAAPALDIPVEPAPQGPGANAEATPTPSDPTLPAAAERPSDEKPADRKATAGASLYDREPDRKVNAAEPAPKPLPEPAPTSFPMPGSAHVKIDVPKGLEADLAKDTRMEPWLKKGVAAATSCYRREAKTQPTLTGTIEVAIVMRENDRPDASIKTLPPQLSGLFACLTGAMMNSRMPLFTGKEGQRYTARVTFKP